MLFAKEVGPFCKESRAISQGKSCPVARNVGVVLQGKAGPFARKVGPLCKDKPFVRKVGPVGPSCWDALGPLVGMPMGPWALLSGSLVAYVLGSFDKPSARSGPAVRLISAIFPGDSWGAQAVVSEISGSTKMSESLLVHLMRSSRRVPIPSPLRKLSYFLGLPEHQESQEIPWIRPNMN